ncbi:MAG TPA: PLP-dependent aminotransferase family protein [Myxococcota bacterium]|jgi:GntR family transcriptional regulator/MocR family aminotransferase|nr:PLP-dependent aminotransferase family protein [Myxococcota bacterium]
MLWLRLDGEGPLHRQAYRALREAILAGRLGAGTRLASTRNLARELGVSRNTVLQAFEQLVAEGYATPRAGSGTYVADALPARAEPPAKSSARAAAEASARAEPSHLSAYGERLTRGLPAGRVTWNLPRERVACDFRYGEPAYADLPLATWARVLGRRARRLSVKRLAYQSPGGADELRAALAGYLARARGVVCSPDQIVVTQGSQQAVDLVTRVLVDPGDRVVLEEPHYTGFSFCLTALGAELAYVRVDEQGLRVDELEALGPARLVCVTPSHQYPAGGVLSLPRRLALLEWARRHGAHVLEDDYDGEFRFEGRPLECLQSLDRHGRVIYVGTASKLLFPALRIGWLVAPPDLAPHLQAAKALCDTGTATLEQLAFADFIAEGHLERHVRRARARHAARRAALVDAVTRELGSRAEVLGVDAGLHVLLRVPELSGRDVTRLREACRERGVAVYPAAPYYARPPARAELLLGYGSLPERTIRDGVRRLREAVDALA